MAARPRAELSFGSLALALEPRALAAPIGARASGEHASLELASAGLGATARARLAELRGARLAPLTPGLERLDAPCAELERLAAEEPAAALLQLAWSNATAPPSPVRLMGVVNATPDSFSDGGLFAEPARAIEHGLALAAEGADLLDVGGESTRPGASPVELDLELERVLPVVAALARASGVPLSIDTTKSRVAAAALAAGARVVNDVSAARLDPEMLATVARTGAACVLVHMRGTPRDMQADPRYDDCVRAVTAELRARVAACLKAGIPLSRIALDPGIGFGKRLEHNLELIRRLPELRSLGLPLVVGVSRKRFIGELSGVELPARRQAGTAAAVTACVLNGADVLRVHDVGAMREVVAVATALSGAHGNSSPVSWP